MKITDGCVWIKEDWRYFQTEKGKTLLKWLIENVATVKLVSCFKAEIVQKFIVDNYSEDIKKWQIK
jgi:hypothetical protein